VTNALPPRKKGAAGRLVAFDEKSAEKPHEKGKILLTKGQGYDKVR